MTTVIRRRPLLRAVAIGGGAYFDGLMRIETTTLLESLGASRTDRLRLNRARTRAEERELDE